MLLYIITAPALALALLRRAVRSYHQRARAYIAQ